MTVCIVALLMIVPACTWADAPPTDPEETGQQQPVPDDGRVLGPRYNSLATTATENMITLGDDYSVPWAVNGSMPNADVIFIAYVAAADGARGCGEHLGSHVVETSTTITITAVNRPARNLAECLARPGFGGGSIELLDVLGDRQLLHGPLSAPWNTEPSPFEFAIPTPEPTPEKLAPPYDGDATCENLLDESTLDRFRDDGYEFRGAEFTKKVANEPELGLIHDFLVHGGIVCGLRRGPEDQVFFAWGPIDAAAADPVRARLTEGGFKHSCRHGYERWVAEDESGGAAYAFQDFFWAAAYGEGSKHILDEITANAPR